jgi:hypothetical protein
MQLEDSFDGNAEIGAPLMDHLEGIAIPPDLLFVAITQWWLPEDYCADSSAVNLDPLDTVRGNGTFDERMLTQRLQLLR